jgi:putative ABC transport system permease protein
MNNSVLVLTISDLLWAFLPVAVVLWVLNRWTTGVGTAIHAVARMLIQLLLIGYVLVAIFESDEPAVILLVLTVMLLAASWISVRPLSDRRLRVYGNALAAIVVGGVSTLIIVIRLVIDVEPWFLPRYVVPLAGMIFASSMNTISLAGERFEAECGRGAGYVDARGTAIQAAMIPLLNSLFAVGLVALPGMMTGQILSGVSPLIAAKYQIVVMCMIFGASGISAAVYLALAGRQRIGVIVSR